MVAIAQPVSFDRQRYEYLGKAKKMLNTKITKLVAFNSGRSIYLSKLTTSTMEIRGTALQDAHSVSQNLGSHSLLVPRQCIRKSRDRRTLGSDVQEAECSQRLFKQTI